MVSGIRFFGGSGSMGLFGVFGEKTVDTVYTERTGANLDPGTPLLEIFNIVNGQDSSPNRMGFFGSAGAPNGAVIVGQYQDRTHVTNLTGSDFGEMMNNKFTGAALASPSGDVSVAINTLPGQSGTLLCRFTEPNGTAVVTQQATFRAVNMTVVGALADINDLATNIVIQAAQLADTAGNGSDASWTEISSGGAVMALNDQTNESYIHDFSLLVSGSPAVAGRKTDFAYFLQLEFL